MYVGFEDKRTSQTRTTDGIFGGTSSPLKAYLRETWCVEDPGVQQLDEVGHPYRYDYRVGRSVTVVGLTRSLDEGRPGGEGRGKSVILSLTPESFQLSLR